MALFRDATGQTGPATWEMGTYVAGQDDFPVSGVSWFEAAAYARWAGKSLPTIYHWSRAADQRLSADVVPASNFRGKGLVPAGSSGGLTRSGTADMAGNVKEWCANAAGPNATFSAARWTNRSICSTIPTRSRRSRVSRRTASAASRRIGRTTCAGTVGADRICRRATCAARSQSPNRCSRRGAACIPSTTAT